MSDPFASTAQSLTSPATRAIPVTPDDAAPLVPPSRAIYVGQGGALRVEMVSGDIVTLSGLVGGAIYPLRVSRVMATGTDAANIVALG